MEQVLRNLLSNALKFSKEMSTITVQVGFQPLKSPDVSSMNASTVGRRLSQEGLKITNGFVGAKRRVASLQARLFSSKAVRPNAPGVASPEGDALQREADADADDPDKWVQGNLVVTVTDTGAGISKENQKLLFREGQQFDPHKLQGGGGSGFGLFISKSIVVLHGGRMTAYSKGEGQGTSFTFSIPMRRAKADMEKAERSRQEPATNRYTCLACRGDCLSQHARRRRRPLTSPPTRRTDRAKPS